MPQPPPARSEESTAAAEERVVLRDVAWSTYQSLLADLADQSAPRLTYDHGTLEIMMPLPAHEAVNRTLALFVEVLAEELQVDVQDLGSTTFRLEELKRGFEPDSCFYIQHEADVRGKDSLDLTVDPPPDLAIEIEITRGAILKFPIYAALGVPEVWRYDGKRLRMFVLEAGTYAEQPHSRAFPRLSSEAMTDWLNRSRTARRTALLRDFRAWVGTIAG